MFKKILQEYEISDLLFKISNHTNLEIQISATSSLCNFLLDLKKVLLCYIKIRIKMVLLIVLESYLKFLIRLNIIKLEVTQCLLSKILFIVRIVNVILRKV